MKLIYCPYCQDLFKLIREEKRYCKCKKCYGRYKDNLNAEVNSEAISIGFNNGSFVAALKKRPKIGIGQHFEAFIIPENCNTIFITDKKKKEKTKKKQTIRKLKGRK